MSDAATVMDNPADLINVAIESLVKERYELPAYSSLDRLARRVRTLANQRLFAQVMSKCLRETLDQLDAMMTVAPQDRQSAFNRLKQLPKRPSLQNLQRLVDRLEWLRSLEASENMLFGLTDLKIKHFAAEAKSLDASEMRQHLPPKRYALLLCLIHLGRQGTGCR